MKTKELIRLLQIEDPTGEAECCIDNADILCVERMPAYYDGRLEVLIRDPSLPYYNVVGAKITGSGVKVNIHRHSIEDALYDDPDLPVTVEPGGERYEIDVDEWREAGREVKP